MNLGETIKKYRLAHKMKQSELADILNVSTQTISSWEKNRTRPTLEILTSISNVFKCNLSAFLDEKSFEYSFLEDQGFSEDECLLLKYYRALNISDKATVLRILKGLKG